MDTVNLCAKKRWAFTYSSFFPPSYLSRMWVFKGTEHDQGPRRLIAVAEGERRGSPDLWMCQRKLNTPGTSRGFAGRAEKSDRTPLRRPYVAALRGGSRMAASSRERSFRKQVSPEASIPWLLLESVRGTGGLEAVQFIHRSETHGGTAPSENYSQATAVWVHTLRLICFVEERDDPSE